MSLFHEMVGKITDLIVEHEDHDIETEGDKGLKWIKNFYKEHYEEVVGLKYLAFCVSLKEIKNEELRGYTKNGVKIEMKKRLADKMEKIIDIYDSYIIHIGKNQLYALDNGEESINEIGKFFSQRTLNSNNAYAMQLGKDSVFLSSFLYFVQMAKLFDKFAYKTENGWELHNRDPEKNEAQNKRGRNPIGFINYFLIALGLFFTVAGLSDGEYFSAFILGFLTIVNWATARLLDKVGWSRPWYPAHYWYIVTTSFLLIICVFSFVY